MTNFTVKSTLNAARDKVNNDYSSRWLTLLVLESIMETCSVVLTLKSVEEILWCDHSNEMPVAILLHGSICF